MKKYILFILIAYRSFCFGSESCDEILQTAINMFEQQVDQHMNQSHIPGLAVVVTHDGQAVYTNAFGHRDTKNSDPVTNDTLFRLASNSKMLTAIAVLQIWEKGLIEIDQPVAKYLTWFKQKDSDNRWEKITIRQLLNHTAGISRCEGSDAWEKFVLTGNVQTSEEMIPGAINQEMILEPGTRLKYSNLGYWFLSQLISEYGGAAGQTADEKYVNYIKENILAPLQMDDSGFVIDAAKSHQLAKPYGMFDPFTNNRETLPSIFNPGGFNGSGGFYSSANDLSKFLLWLTSAFNGERNLLLQPDTMSMMISDPVKDPNSSSKYGLGIIIKNGPNGLIVGHSGTFPGYRSQIMVDLKTGIGIAIALNTTEIDAMKYWNLAFQTIGKALQKLPPELPKTEEQPPLKEIPTSSTTFKNIVGYYKQEMFGEYVIYEDFSGTLICDLFGNKLSMQLVSQSPGKIDFKLGWEGAFSSFNGEKISIFLDDENKAEYLIIGNSFRDYRIRDL